MASIEEVRAGIHLACEKVNESSGALQQADASIEEAQASLLRVTEGSAQADTNEANGQLARALEMVRETQQMVKQVVATAESIAQRL